MLKKYKLLLIFLISFVILSFKIGSVPYGLTIDEASFGYNAVLISRTLHDENGRFLPVFVLSINKTDWRQPITQYFIATVFKVGEKLNIYKPSISVLRLTTVIVSAFSIAFISLLGGISASILLIMTPVYFMHSHLALDNLMPVPFILIWLYSIYKYSLNRKISFLILAGVTIGLGFYSYKGIRVFLPVWIITSSVFIFLNGKWKALVVYLLSMSPFFLVIPYLEFKYAGAVLNNEKLKFEGFYQFIYRYLSYFDLSFLYVQGDSMLIHSTLRHGTYLLSGLPLFLIGVVKSWKKDLYHKFLVTSFFFGPIMFGFFGLIHRSSKIISEVPFYILISVVGATWLYKNYRKLYVLIFVLIFLNFFDFFNYYLFKYPEISQDVFYKIDSGMEYKTLKEISLKYNLVPYVDASKVSNNFSSGDFVRSIYFTIMPNTWNGDSENLPLGSVVMTDNQNIKDLEKLPYSFKNFVYYKK